MTSVVSPPNAAAPATALHERVFRADPSQVGAARAFLSGILAGCPVAEEAVLCLSELASNAVVHSRSREPGGVFTVRAQLTHQRLRVEVSDQGGPWHSQHQPSPGDSEPAGTPTHPSPDEPSGTPTHPSPDEPAGRGLLIVGQLATRWGCAGHSRTGWTVWFELETGR